MISILKLKFVYFGYIYTELPAKINYTYIRHQDFHVTEYSIYRTIGINGLTFIEKELEGPDTYPLRFSEPWKKVSSCKLEASKPKFLHSTVKGEKEECVRSSSTSLHLDSAT